jgi:hypothetical protein
VLVEVDSPDYGEDESRTDIGPASRRRWNRDSPSSMAFEEHLNGVRDAAVAALDVFRQSMRPDEIKLSFGVKFTAQAGAVIARTAFEGNLAVELLWQRDTTGPDRQ